MSGRSETWLLLRERFRSWTGNLLSVTRSTAAMESLRELAHRKRMSPERFLDVADHSPLERQQLIERLTIRTTWFMREPDAILALANAFKKRAALTGATRVGIWSVACATGEEPYTLAMAVADAGLEPIILATDISNEARAFAELGQYPRSRVDDLPLRWRQRFFAPTGSDRMQVSASIRNAVSFMEHNLAASQRPPAGWAMFDAVVCRNVLLYFDRDEAVRLLRELALTCREEGYLLLSAAEHPLAWSISTLGFDATNDTPLLRRRRRGESGPLPATTRPDLGVLYPADSGTPRRDISALIAINSMNFPASATRAPTGTYALPGAAPAAAPAPAPVAPAPTPPPPAAPPAPGAVAYHKDLHAANVIARGGDVDTALAILKRIVDRDAMAAPAYLAMGLLWKKQGRLTEATSALRRARFLFGDDSWLAPYTLAVCLEARGDWREALEGYRHAAAVLEWGGPSGLVDPESNEQDFSSTVLESCLRRMGTLQSRT
jgi:chemotaxis methyl-accepting protein methylase